ncbi:hypothetical protein [Natrialba aegyptia]|uniref:Uncharacterized protein n=1 Tax=Natrialba aegyptia DSM 13077 TaxID=1227491 RepID=M0ATX3_9EURY|nr:hypothetical protein [Natrialba aegyptia]ELZ01388.1 hypothetical protein C480_17942 [Natrialba aegyptia DSM 13077]
MGAVSFEALAFGKTADDAFRNAVEDAKHMHGHGGYTGTIVEKSSFEVIPKREHHGKQKRRYAHQLIEDGDERIQRKRGPAGAINCSGTNAAIRYRKQHELEGKHGDVRLFFGWVAH